MRPLLQTFSSKYSNLQNISNLNISPKKTNLSTPISGQLFKEVLCKSLNGYVYWDTLNIKLCLLGHPEYKVMLLGHPEY